MIKVAASQVKNASGFWPPALPDAVETIAASYVDTDPSSKIRLFNLSPGTVSAGMTLAGKSIATNVAYGLGSDWVKVPTVSSSFTFVDDLSKKTLATKTVRPAAAPIGNSEVLLGLQTGGADFGMQVVSLVDGVPHSIPRIVLCFVVQHLRVSYCACFGQRRKGARATREP